MRPLLRNIVRATTSASLVLSATAASAGLIATENAKTGISGSWTAGDDGSAAADGVVDIYPGQWSISPGDTVALKVRSTTAYDVRIMRLGWYGGAGATEVKLVTGLAASPQPYPTADSTSGLTEAKWSTTLSVPTDASWTPGLYVARAEQSSGKQAVTFFVVRDDKLATKLPILLVVGTLTHEAYNAWPGPTRGGKSLYGFNSGTTHPSESIGTLTQAVRVSLDRPFLVGAGTADLANYEYPFTRWLEKGGWDVAYATDQDLHANPSLALGRKIVTLSGHEEYTSWQMFDNAIAARNAGVNYLLLSGDTWSWQVRLEAGAGGPLSTVVGYKESFVKDPEQKIAYSLKTAGRIDEAKTHYRIVTRGWKNLEYDPASGIDERRPGMLLTGVQSAGIIRDASGSPTGPGSYPWADLVVVNPSFWIFAGTGLTAGAKIRNVFGYEVDSTLASDPSFDPFRPAPAVLLGRIVQVSDGTTKGSAAFYRHTGGAEVVAMGANFPSWALDGWAAAQAGVTDSVDPAFQKMITNALERWTATTPPPPPPDAGPIDAGPEPDATPVEMDVGAVPDVELVDVSDVGAADTLVPPSDSGALDTLPAPDAPSESAPDAPSESAPDAPSEDTSAADTFDATFGDVGTGDTAPPTDGATTPPVDEGGGCGCTTAGRTGIGGTGVAAFLGIALALRRRRRAIG